MTTKTDPSIADLAAAYRPKVEDLMAAVSGEIIGRDDVLHAVIRALITGTHLFVLSLPGMAKSLLFERVVMRIGGLRYGMQLMGAFTGVEDVYGPLDVAALEDSRFVRKIAGYLPDCHVYFFDEMWKGNDAINNTNLQAINERKYKQDGVLMDIPLSTVFAASNELPSSGDLAAIYDRIICRMQIHKISQDQFVRMLQVEIPDTVDEILDWSEIETIKAHVATIPVAPAVLTALAEIRRELAEKNIEPSDRRFRQILQVMQGEAFLDGADEVDTDHLPAIVDCLWEDPEQIEAISKIVLDKANPLQAEIQALLGEVNSVKSMIERAEKIDDKEERHAVGMEAHRKLRAAFKEFEKLEQHPAAASKRNAALLADGQEKVREYSADLVTRVFRAAAPGTGTTPQP
jgi:MoxR-like ATPase